MRYPRCEDDDPAVAEVGQSLRRSSLNDLFRESTAYDQLYGLQGSDILDSSPGAADTTDAG